jgi:hypothetical protein
VGRLVPVLGGRVVDDRCTDRDLDGRPERDVIDVVGVDAHRGAVVGHHEAQRSVVRSGDGFLGILVLRPRLDEFADHGVAGTRLVGPGDARHPDDRADQRDRQAGEQSTSNEHRYLPEPQVRSSHRHWQAPG